MERKVVIKTEFEFYPDADDTKTLINLSNDELIERVKNALDDLLNENAGDGLWWHYESAEVKESN